MRGLGLRIGLLGRRAAVEESLPAITTVTPNPINDGFFSFTLGSNLGELAGSTVLAISIGPQTAIPYDPTMVSGWWFSGGNIVMDGPNSPVPLFETLFMFPPYNFFLRFTKNGKTSDSPTIYVVQQ